MIEPEEAGSRESGELRAVPSPARRFHIEPGNLLDVVQPEQADEPLDPLESDDPYNALGRKVARVDVEPEFATLYLTFEDGTYLTLAARLDEEGVILLDRFCEPAADYGEYFVFDDLEGESGPPPEPAAPEPGTGYDPATWSAAAGRTVHDLGWYEEGMQAFVHFEDGAYLTVAARFAEGRAYLVGYFSPATPPDGDFVVFELGEDEEPEGE